MCHIIECQYVKGSNCDGGYPVYTYYQMLISAASVKIWMERDRSGRERLKGKSYV